MTNWKNYSLGSQVPFGAVNPSMITRTETPAAAPAATSAPANPSFDLSMLANPLAMLSKLGDKSFSPFSLNGSTVSMGGPFAGLIGGLLSPLLSSNSKTTSEPAKPVIDQRNPETQALVSMFQNGGLK